MHQSFIDAYSKKDGVQFLNDNTLRSSYFLSELARSIHSDFFIESKLNVPIVEDESIHKKSGEWLYDFCITSQIEIVDINYQSKALVNTEVLFAAESEFSTSISDFAIDFSKLLCSKATQYCYVQGLNQKTEEGRKKFINGRQDIIRNQLNELIIDDFVLAFVPTPGKVDGNSFWELEGVKDWIRIFIYNKSANSFIEYPIKNKSTAK